MRRGRSTAGSVARLSLLDGIAGLAFSWRKKRLDTVE
jgi:hypothetical protein